MKGTIRILDASGHTTVPFDTDEDTAKAEAVLHAARINRSAVFDTQTREQVSHEGIVDLDNVLSEHENLLVIPPMAGGR